MRASLVFCFLISISVHTFAKVSLNSMCYLFDQGTQSKIHGDRADELFEIASVSKVVTSYWALHELGPQYRFNTRINVIPVARDLYDVHIEGSLDPFFGRQLTHFLVSELNRKNIYSVRRLSFDENFSYRWAVLTDNVEPSNPSPQEVADSLSRHIRALTSEYPSTRKEALAAGLTLPNTLRLKVETVAFVAKSDFRAPSDVTLFWSEPRFFGHGLKVHGLLVLDWALHAKC